MVIYWILWSNLSHTIEPPCVLPRNIGSGDMSGVNVAVNMCPSTNPKSTKPLVLRPSSCRSSTHRKSIYIYNIHISIYIYICVWKSLNTPRDTTKCAHVITCAFSLFHPLSRCDRWTWPRRWRTAFRRRRSMSSFAKALHGRRPARFEAVWSAEGWLRAT